MAAKDNFDMPQAADEPSAAPLTPPADLLSADKVAAVRFHPTKPGYAYNQVEIFVEQVLATLSYLEKRMHQDSVELYEARDEISYLQEKVMTLQATIEVFRAKGDPVTAADGSYVTESQVAGTAEMEALRQQRDALIAELEAQKEETARAWAAEDELRRYLDEQLTPWIAAVTAQRQNAAPAPAPEPVAPTPAEQPAIEPVAEPEPVALEAPEPLASEVPELETEDATQLAPLTASEMEALLAQQQDVEEFDLPEMDEPEIASQPAASTVAEGSDEEDWAGAPSVNLGAEQPVTTAGDWDAEPAVAQAAPAVKPKKSKRLLAQAPEVAGMGLQMAEDEIPDEPALGDSSTPPPAGAPIPRLLAESPEAQMLRDQD